MSDHVEMKRTATARIHISGMDRERLGNERADLLEYTLNYFDQQLADRDRELQQAAAENAVMREALTEIEPLHDSMVHGDECRAHNEGDCDAGCTEPCATLDDCECCLASSIIARRALALTPATVGVTIRRDWTLDEIVTYCRRSNYYGDGQPSDAPSFTRLANAIMVLSDRAPGKGNDK